MTFFIAWFIADFLTGIVHWFEDQVLKPGKWALINRIVSDNELHHVKPLVMLKGSYWENIKISCMIAWPIASVLYYMSAPTFVWLGIFLASFGNLIHRWAHEPKSRLNPYIVLLQSTGFLLSFESHHGHHFDGRKLIPRSRAKKRYCAMSCYLNPILDAIHFWDLLNKLV